MAKETDWEESSGNVFADLGLDQPEKLLAKIKTFVSSEHSHKK